MMLAVGSSVGCKLPLVWETPDSPGDPVLSPTPDLALTLLGTLGPPESIASQTPTQLFLTPTPPSQTATPAPTRLPYILQPGAPVAGPNFSDPEIACAWSGVAGQVLNGQRQPVNGLLIEVVGVYDGEPVQALAMTGTAPGYGPGGYEIQLGNRPVQSSQELFIRVFDVSGSAVSDLYPFDTFENCEQNLVLITFIEAYDFPNKWFLPMVMN